MTYEQAMEAMWAFEGHPVEIDSIILLPASLPPGWDHRVGSSRRVSFR